MKHTQSDNRLGETGPTTQVNIDGPNVEAKKNMASRPSDTLEGQMVISSAVTLDFDETHFFLEG